MNADDFKRDYPALNQPLIDWGEISARFTFGETLPPVETIAKVTVVPFSGDKIIIVRMKTGLAEIPGGTIEENEPIQQAAERELMEEAGARLHGNLHFFGHFHCRTSATEPYKPHMPHPAYTRVIGWAHAEIVGAPTMPPDGEIITAVETLSVSDACAALAHDNRHDLAELCRLAAAMRTR